MSLNEVEVTLASATLSGGARLASASGSLPQRITTEADGYIEAGISATQNGLCLDSDGLHVWTTNYDTTHVKKWLISSGAAVVTLAGSRPLSISPGHDLGSSVEVIVVKTPGPIVEFYDSQGATVWSWTSPASTGGCLRVPGGTAGKVWVGSVAYNGTSSVLTEVTASTGVATGRSITVSTGAGYFWHACGGTGYDNLPSIYVVDGTGKVKRYREDTLALVDTWIAGTMTTGHLANMAGTGLYGGLAVDTDGFPLVIHHYAGGVDKLSGVGGGTGIAYAERKLHGDVELGGAIGVFQGGYLISPTLDRRGDYLAFTTSYASGLRGGAVRVVNIGTQRARFAYAFSSEATVQRITVPGDLARASGPVVGITSVTSHDHRRSRCYYSTDGGVNRTEFAPGDDVSVPVAAGGTLTVDVDFCVWGSPAGPPPWVGDSVGGGVRLLYEGITPPVSGDVDTTTVGAIITWATDLVEGATPSSRSDIRYQRAPSRVAFEEWVGSTPGTTTRRFAIRRLGERREIGVANPEALLAERDLEVVIAYALTPRAAGDDDLYDVDDIADEDARQVRDLLIAPGNHTIDGHCATFPRVGQTSLVDVPGAVVLRIPLTVVYYEAQSYA